MSDMGDDYHRRPRGTWVRAIVWMAVGASGAAFLVGVVWFIGQLLMGLR